MILLQTLLDMTFKNTRYHLYVKYNKLTHQFKNIHPINNFREVLFGASMSIFLIPIWGFPNLMSLLGVIVSVLYTFYQKNMIVQLLMLLAIFVVLHKLIVGKMQTNFTLFDKQTKKFINRLRAKIDLFSVPFQFREFSPSVINNMNNDIKDKQNVIENKWVQIMNLTRLFNNLISVIIGYFNTDDVASFMLITLVLNQLSNAVTNMTYFSTRYNRLRNDYNNYVDFWKDAEYVEEPVKLEIDDSLTVTDVNIKKGNFVVTWDKFEFNFYIGMKIMIIGKTGSGKSTFLEALTGKIKGVTMSNGNPENYYHNMSDMYQNIREKMASTKVTIRDFFKGEIDDNLIRECLLDTFDEQELEQWLNALDNKTDSEDKDTFVIDLDENIKKNPFDKELDEKLFGGQKSRLCLATRCYEILKFKKQVFIMDEPEQGSDSDTIIRVVNHLFDKYKNCTIIMITHMCNCQRKQLKVNWDLEFGGF